MLVFITWSCFVFVFFCFSIVLFYVLSIAYLKTVKQMNLIKVVAARFNFPSWETNKTLDTLHFVFLSPFCGAAPSHPEQHQQRYQSEFN